MSNVVRANADSRPFINYAREDAGIAKRIFDDLRAMGASPWLDTEKLLGGQDWKREVRQAIRTSSHFIALISKNSVSKQGYVQSELREALEVLNECPPDKVFIVPIRLDNSQPTHERLKDLNWIDLLPDYDVGLKKLALSLGIVPQGLADAVAGPATDQVTRAISISNEHWPAPTGTVDVREVVRSVVDGMRPSAERRNINLVLRLTPRDAGTTVSRQLLELAVFNLIDNAIKYSVVPDIEKPRGRPWVSISVRASEQYITISVESWGIPFTRVELENDRIFSPGFVGVFARQLNIASSGLGLWTVKKLADEAGGSVRIHTDPVTGGGGVERRCTIVSLRFPKIPRTTA